MMPHYSAIKEWTTDSSNSKTKPEMRFAKWKIQKDTCYAVPFIWISEKGKMIWSKTVQWLWKERLAIKGTEVSGSWNCAYGLTVMETPLHIFVNPTAVHQTVKCTVCKLHVNIQNQPGTGDSRMEWWLGMTGDESYKYRTQHYGREGKRSRSNKFWKTEFCLIITGKKLYINIVLLNIPHRSMS